MQVITEILRFGVFLSLVYMSYQDVTTRYINMLFFIPAGFLGISALILEVFAFDYTITYLFVILISAFLLFSLTYLLENFLSIGGADKYAMSLVVLSFPHPPASIIGQSPKSIESFFFIFFGLFIILFAMTATISFYLLFNIFRNLYLRGITRDIPITKKYVKTENILSSEGYIIIDNRVIDVDTIKQYVLNDPTVYSGRVDIISEKKKNVLRSHEQPEDTEKIQWFIEEIENRKMVVLSPGIPLFVSLTATIPISMFLVTLFI